MARSGISMQFLPPNSPDQNCIANLFGLVRRKWDETSLLTTVEEKLTFILQERISQETINNLVDSTPRRLAAMKEARGGPTKY